MSTPLTIERLKADNLILLECLSGSRAYGLATPASDVDIKGVFYLPKPLFYGQQSDYVAQVSNASNDVVYYELGRYVELLLQNNPNMMELLATPAACVRYRHPLMRQLHPAWFISKLCQHTFAGFANSQIKKARGLNKKIVNPIAKEKKSILEFCHVLVENKSVPLLHWLKSQPFTQRQLGLAAMPKTTQIFAMYVDTEDCHEFAGLIQKPNATQLKLSSIPKGLTPIAYLSFNQQGFSKYCKDYKEYWLWVAQRNEVRYQSTLNHGKQYDAKNIMHTIRLLQMALDIAQFAEVRVARPNRTQLLAIKAGQYQYDELITLAEQLSAQIDSAFAQSTLPDTPDHKAAIAALVAIRQQLY